MKNFGVRRRIIERLIVLALFSFGFLTLSFFYAEAHPKPTMYCIKEDTREGYPDKIWGCSDGVYEEPQPWYHTLFDKLH